MLDLHMARSPEEAAPRSTLLNSCEKHSLRVDTLAGLLQVPLSSLQGESQVPAEPSSGSLCILHFWGTCSTKDHLQVMVQSHFLLQIQAQGSN